jgi:hypothetical protein
VTLIDQKLNGRLWHRLCNNSNLWIFVFNFDLKTLSTMNIGSDLRLIIYFIDTATHCQRRKISFYTVWAHLRRSANGSLEREAEGCSLTFEGLLKNSGRIVTDLS